MFDIIGIIFCLKILDENIFAKYVTTLNFKSAHERKQLKHF